MCTYSMIVDHFSEKWQRRVDEPTLTYTVPYPAITQAELDEFRELLKRAREYDKRNNEPDCELESKKERVRKLAEELGVKVDFL